MKIQITGLCMALVLSASSRQAAAQGAAFTYQGRITDNGTNFTGVGQFEFALVTPANTSSGARGFVDSIYEGTIGHVSVVQGGSGYITAPAVTLDYIGLGLDHGSNAVLTAVVTGGVVTAINVTAGGANYPDYVGLYWATVAPPPANYTNLTLWNNDGTEGSEPLASVSVPVTNGLFTVALGDTTLSNMTTIPANAVLAVLIPESPIADLVQRRGKWFCSLKSGGAPDPCANSGVCGHRQ
ncbi:MAG: hypothetical protein ACLQVW_32625 [Limisphaerales bacterium]